MHVTEIRTRFPATYVHGQVSEVRYFYLIALATFACGTDTALLEEVETCWNLVQVSDDLYRIDADMLVFPDEGIIAPSTKCPQKVLRVHITSDRTQAEIYGASEERNMALPTMNLSGLGRVRSTGDGGSYIIDVHDVISYSALSEERSLDLYRIADISVPGI